MTTVMLHCVQPVLTAGFQSVLENLDGFALSSVCSGMAEVMERVGTERPNILLIEVTPAVTLDILGKLVSSSANAAVVLWIDEVAIEFASQAIAIGVRGLLRKSLSLDLQAKCLRKVAEGEMWVEKSLSDKLLSIRRVGLSPRERQLLGLLAQGLKNKEIAFSLGITEGTVKVYLTRLFRKVGVADRFELALFTLKNVSVHQTGNSAAAAQSEAASFDSAGSTMFVPSFIIMEPDTTRLR